MSIFFAIIVTVVILIIYNLIMKRIDEDEKKSMKTPGVAEYIRKNFSEIIDCITATKVYTKEFERSDYIRFVKSDRNQKLILQQWSGKLKIALEKNGKLIKEWNIGIKDLNSLIISEIKKTIATYSYWDSYKERDPQKAKDILELTHINMDKQSDQAVREITESIERWARNTNKPIAELKKYFVDSVIKTFGSDGIEVLLDRLKSTEMSKEAVSFCIEKEHTIARFMIEAINEYLQSNQTSRIEEHLKNTLGVDLNEVHDTMQELNIAPDISNLNNKENRLIALLEECCTSLSREYKPLSTLGRCEAMLFFSTFIMDYGVIENEIDMDVFEDRFKLLLVDKMIEFDVDDTFGFLNDRVKFYKEEYAKMKSNTHYSSLALYNAFYTNPGCTNTDELRNTVSDPLELMLFNVHIASQISYINNTKDSI